MYISSDCLHIEPRPDGKPCRKRLRFEHTHVLRMCIQNCNKLQFITAKVMGLVGHVYFTIYITKCTNHNVYTSLQSTDANRAGEGKGQMGTGQRGSG